MRARLPILFALLATTVVHAGTQSVKSIDGLATGSQVRIEGVLSMRGSTPLTIMILEVPDHPMVEITLKPHDENVHQQLRSLDGLRVMIEGEVIPRLDPEIPRLDVKRCDLLKAPDGGDPITGVVNLEDGACVVTADNGKRYWITGDLALALCQHAGARVWMVGKKGKKGDGQKPRDATAFAPTGYGVIE
jgi:hypothetical protein